MKDARLILDSQWCRTISERILAGSGWLSSFFSGRFLVLLFHLLGLQSRLVDPPDDETKANVGEKSNKEDPKNNRLIVENGDSLIGGADGREPVELSHGEGLQGV